MNPYYFAKELKAFIGDDGVIVLGNSTIAAHIIQMGVDTEQQRIINNMNCGSMGYDLPAAIGASVARNRPVTLVTGDGSIMLNLQELMTIRHYNLPIKIFISCNGGYRGIVRSQGNMFGHYIGCTPETGVAFPDFEKVACSFDIPFYRIKDKDDVEPVLEKIYDSEGPVICVWPQDPEQVIEPRVMNRKSADGCIVSTPIDDLSPFLSKEEYESNQFVNWVKSHAR